jgi:hypothetical protein
MRRLVIRNVHIGDFMRSSVCAAGANTSKIWTSPHLAPLKPSAPAVALTSLG